MGEEERARGGLSGSFLLVVLLFIAAVVDLWYFSNGFIVSNGWRANRGVWSIAVLIVAVLLWWAVLIAARRREVAPSSEVAVEVVRGTNWAIQPIFAFLLLFATAAIALSHTIPKYVHSIEGRQYTTVPFVIAEVPGDERRGCRPAKAKSPEFGDVTLCLPGRVASELTADATVYVSGERTRFGIEPMAYALQGPATPEPSPEPQPVVADEPEFNLDDFLRDAFGDGPAVPTPTVEPPQPTTVDVPLRGGKDKNR
jgi:hypothetical protein